MTKPEFRYRHTGAQCMPTDVRRNQTPIISMLDCFFLGFRIKDDVDCSYHNAWILADDHQAFLKGVALKRYSILETHPLLSDRDVELVHVQSLKFRHCNIGDDVRKSISEAFHEMVALRNDRKFVFLGLTEGCDYVVSEHDPVDAIGMLELARAQWTNVLEGPVWALAVLQAHPAMKELGVLFQMQAQLIEPLIVGAPESLPN